LQTADGALEQVNGMLGRMSELAVQAGNETLAAADRQKIEAEMNGLKSEIDRISETATFNDQKLLDGSFQGKNIQAGTEATGGNQIDISIGNMNWDAISGGGAVNLQSSSQIAETMDYIKTAQQNVSTMRADIGATQNR
jgi:flagellin